MSFKKSLLKNIITLGGYNYVSQIAGFLSSIVLSRLLLPEEYGFVALITVFTGFVSVFSDVGLSYAIIRSDYGLTYHKALSNLAFYIGFILFLITMSLAFLIGWFYDDRALILPTMVMSSIFIFGAFAIVPNAILMKRLDFNYIGKIRLVSNVISILLMIVFAAFGFSYWSLIIPVILMHISQYAFFEYKVRLGFKFYKFSYPRVAYRKTKSLIKNLSSFNIINYWSRNSDNLIIGKYYSSYDLGIYNRAYKMLDLANNLIGGIFGTVLYPSLKKLKSEGGNVNDEYRSILGIISIISYPIGAVLILIPDLFVRVLWGKDWIMVADLLPYFGILIIFKTLVTTTGHMFILLEKEKVFMQIGVISAIIMTASIIIGAFFSVRIIAISYTAGFLFINVPLYLYFGFYKTFGQTVPHILKFWVPKIVFGACILIAELMGWRPVLYGMMILYGIHLVHVQRHDLKKLREMLTARIGKNVR
ncbi:MAG: oligosaccharide flippase family protein [Bacteroidales bacterium]